MSARISAEVAGWNAWVSNHLPQPGVEPLAADDRLDRAQERRALVVDDAALAAVGRGFGGRQVQRGTGASRPFSANTFSMSAKLSAAPGSRGASRRAPP
jgi:hypothetical protein